MIRHSIACCLTLLIGYSFLLGFKPQLSASQALWQQNLSKAEHYLYADTMARNAVVGTSISERLVLDDTRDFDNLSFSGLSIFEGLDVLSHKSTLPERVYIETNVLLRKRDAAFDAAMFSPGTLWLRKHVISFRSDKEPLELIGGSLEKAVRKGGTQLKDKLYGRTPQGTRENAQTPNRVLVDDQMLRVEVDEYSEEPDVRVLTEQLQLLKAAVQYLLSKGVDVVFFELPVHPKLENLPKARIVRERMHATFPEERFHYIAIPPDWTTYVTSDGIHLQRDEAIRYTHYFLEHARKFDATY